MQLKKAFIWNKNHHFSPQSKKFKPLQYLRIKYFENSSEKATTTKAKTATENKLP
jgi:hypothetical protein